MFLKKNPSCIFFADGKVFYLARQCLFIYKPLERLMSRQSDKTITSFTKPTHKVHICGCLCCIYSWKYSSLSDFEYITYIYVCKSPQYLGPIFMLFWWAKCSFTYVCCETKMVYAHKCLPYHVPNITFLYGVFEITWDICWLLIVFVGRAFLVSQTNVNARV